MLPVYFEESLVGHLDKAGAGLSFDYASQWRAAPSAFAISLTMPLPDGPFGPEVATPWFANLLPEDRQLERIGRLLGRDQGDVYGLLEEIGRDTAGALSIGEPEPPGRADYRTLDEESLAAAIDRLPERPLLAGEEGLTMSLAGAQSKLTVSVRDGAISLPLYGAASTHILKPASERLYATVENELLCMRLAARVGIAVTPVTMGIAAGRRYLLVARFDRAADETGRVRRHHQEDFCQALRVYPTAKYEASGGPSLAALFETVDRWSRRRARDRLSLIDQLVFACCLGDTDRHAKNYALLVGGDGPRLAPGYDFLTALRYQGITSNLAMRVAGQRRAAHIERRHWRRFAGSVGLAPAATVNRVEELASFVADLVAGTAEALIEETPADAAALRLFADAIRERSLLVAANSRRDTGAPRPAR